MTARPRPSLRWLRPKFLGKVWQATDAPLSLADFHSELLSLGLLGGTFTPASYAAALQQYIGTEIRFNVLRDRDHPLFERRIARTGRMAEMVCTSDPPKFTILLPASLPALLFNLSAYHELGHIAAGHHPQTGGRRLARRAPVADDLEREREADLRARYALRSGSLGAADPYAHDTYDLM